MSLSRTTASRFAVKLACMAGLIVGMVGLSAAPAMASGSAAGCPVGTLSKPFTQFSDSASYAPVSGGSFEAGSAGWSLSNAAIVSGNESFAVAGGTHSLAIQPNGQAVSPAFCVDVRQPTMRFFARQTSGSWGVLNVILRWTDSAGATHDTTLGSLQSGTSWKPSPVLGLASTLPLWNGNESISARLVFKPEQYGGAWAIDDVFADPRMR